MISFEGQDYFLHYIFLYYPATLKQACREFPGSPVVRTQAFTAEGAGSIPGQGTKMPQAVREMNE